MIVLMCAKGSPGVTTLGVALACAAGGVLVEMDRAGGDLALRSGLTQSPGLAELAVRVRRERDPAGPVPLDAFTQHLGSGARMVAAPVSASAVSSVLADFFSDDAAVIGILAPSGGQRVVVDGGQYSPGCLELLSRGSMLAMVARCDAVSLGHAQAWVREFAGACPLGLVLVEHGGFRPGEAAAVLGVPLLGTVPWHPRHATRLTDTATAQTSKNNRLVRAGTSILRSIDALSSTRTQYVPSPRAETVDEPARQGVCP